MQPLVMANYSMPQRYSSNSSMSLKTATLQSSVDESDAVAELLKKRLLEKTRYEAVLVQNLQNAKANEQMLSQQLQNERDLASQLENTTKELESQIENLRMQAENKGRKELGMTKDISALEMKIKDLGATLDKTMDKERKAVQHVSEAHRKSRELESELQDLRMENARLSDAVEKKESQTTELMRTLDQTKDVVIREMQQAQVKTIALQKDVAEKSYLSERLDQLLREIN